LGRERPTGFVSAVWPPAATFAGLLLCLEIASAAGWLPITVPPPSAVIVEFGTSGPDLLYHVWPSILATVAGFAISALVAAAFAAVGSSWRRAGGPVFTLGVLVDSTPLIAVAPILVAFIGGGMTLHVVVAAVACFFPILMGMMKGFRAVDRNSDELFHVLAASRWQWLVKLALPSALPFIFAGFKIAAPLAVLGTLIAEWMGAERGVGIMMIYAMFSFDPPQVWMTIVAVCLMAICGYALFAAAERTFLGWADRDEGGL